MIVYKNQMIWEIFGSPHSILSALLEKILEHPGIDSDRENWFGVHNTKKDSCYLVISSVIPSVKNSMYFTRWVALFNRGSIYYDGIGHISKAYQHFNKEEHHYNDYFDFEYIVNFHKNSSRYLTTEDYRKLNKPSIYQYQYDFEFSDSSMDIDILKLT